MPQPKSPFRTSVSTCALCGVEVESAKLAPVALLDVCDRCRSGELSLSLTFLGFTEEHRKFKVSNNNVPEHVVWVELTRPTEIDVTAQFSAEKGADNWFSRLFRKPDPEVGIEEFDQKIRITVDSEYEASVMRLLDSPGLREAILRLVALRCHVTIGFKTVFARAQENRESKIPPINDVLMYVLLLAIHLERYALTDARERELRQR